MLRIFHSEETEGAKARVKKTVEITIALEYNFFISMPRVEVETNFTGETFFLLDYNVCNCCC